MSWNWFARMCAVVWIVIVLLFVPWSSGVQAAGPGGCVGRWFVSESGVANYKELFVDQTGQAIDGLRFDMGYHDPAHLHRGYLDFDGDAKSDIFYVTTRPDGFLQWWFVPGGSGTPVKLAYASTPLADLRFGDFDGDTKTDVFAALVAGGGFEWFYSAGGTANYASLGQTTLGVNDLRFGNFDGDAKTDVFASVNGVWQYWPGGNAGQAPVVLNNASTLLTDMLFGNFGGVSAKTDVFAVSQGGQWVYSPDGTSPYINRASDSGRTAAELRVGDFNGDKVTDIFAVNPIGNGFYRWLFSNSGTESYVELAFAEQTLDELRLMNYNGDDKTDVFALERTCTSYLPLTQR